MTGLTRVGPAVTSSERKPYAGRVPRPSDRGSDAIWKALSPPFRRHIMDALAAGPLTTSELAATLPELSRFAVMQHLDVLTNAQLVVIERRGRNRYNHVNAATLRDFYERWVGHYADTAATELTALKRHLEEDHMANEPVRVLRLENEMRFSTPPDRVFAALTDPVQILKWFPHTYGGDRVERIVFEPRVGGAQYEDWGEGRGYLYGHVTEWDPPRRYSVRSRLHAGTIMDTTASLEADGEGTLLRSSRVIMGPIDDEQEKAIRFHGDLGRFESAIRKVVEGA